MIASSSYQDKFSLLLPFFEEIVRSIKKEIKRETTEKNSFFRKKIGVLPSNVDGKTLSSLLIEKVATEGDEELGERIGSFWLNKNGDVFTCFHDFLSKISSEYDKLTGIAPEKEKELIDEAVSEFGASRAYIFSILNSVVFSKAALESLQAAALEERGRSETGEGAGVAPPSDRDRAIEKILEKQEKKMQGMALRHQLEIAGYRKQIASLQKKLESFLANPG